MRHNFRTTLLILLCVCMIVPVGADAQHPYSIEWSKCYGGSRNENNSSLGQVIIPTLDGGYIFAGQTSSIDGDIDKSRRQDDIFIKDSCKNDDIWIVKLNAEGEIQWEQYYGGEATDIIKEMSPTSDGGYVLCGITGSISGDFPFDTTGVVKVYLRGGTNDGYVMKIDSLGRKEWVSRIGGSDYDFLYSVKETSDGGFLAVGYTYSTDELWQKLPWIRNKGPWNDAFIVKLGADGTKLWNRIYGGTRQDAVTSFIEKPDGGYILCGGTNSDDGDISKLHYIDSVNMLGPTFDLWMIDVSSSGIINWEKCYGGTSADGPVVMLRAIDGTYIVAGSTLSRDGDVVGYHPERKATYAEPHDVWILNIDTTGKIIWQNCIGGSDRDVLSSIIPTSSGGYAFIGHTYSSDSNLTGIHVDDNVADVWIGELSADGKLLWHQCFGGTRNDYGNGIVETDEGFTIYSSVGSTDGDIVGNHGGEYPHYSDIWVAKLQRTQNGVEASSGGSHFANPYPNPSVNEMNLYIHPTQPVQTVQFFNPLGQEFYPKYQQSGNLLTTDTRTLAKGMYIIRITYQDLTVQEVRKFVKVE